MLTFAAFRPLSLPAFFSRKMSGVSYQDAINSLNTLQSNAATLAAVRATGILLNENAIAEMNEFVTRIGFTVCVTPGRVLLSHPFYSSPTTSMLSMSSMSLVQRVKVQPALSQTQSSDMYGPG